MSLARWTGRAFLGLVLGASAGAQETGTNDPLPAQPVDIRSDKLVVNQKNRTAVFTGRVRTIQGDLQIDCEKLTVFYSGGNQKEGQTGDIQRMVFTGSVAIRQKTRKGHCERAEYDRTEGTIVCTGNPWVIEGENRIRGDRIVYLLERDEVAITRPHAQIRLPDEKKKESSAPR